MKRYIKYLKSLDVFQKIIHFSILIAFILLLILFPISYLILGIISIFVLLWVLFSNANFNSQAIGNGIIFGSRGSGKGLLLNKRINTDFNKKHFCNVPYNKHTQLINIKEYIDSIVPNTTHNFINNNVVKIEKNEKFEKVNIYWDDVGVYAPNFMDNELKKLYPSLSALLPINRHLYDAYMIITIQSYDRAYKLLRELQTDFAIKAVKTNGYGYIWKAIPFLNMITTTKYIYYENPNSASNGLLPFNAKAVVNESLKHGFLTGGQATKEQYKAQHGIIKYGRVFQRKSRVNYDTRYFHNVVFGTKAPPIL